jgi:exportin-T
MISMMHMLVTSGVSSHPHAAVKLQFFETVSRYEKFFNIEPDHIGTILTTFLDERGMRNNNCKVRSRCAYLFSKLVKNLK